MLCLLRRYLIEIFNRKQNYRKIQELDKYSRGDIYVYKCYIKNVRNTFFVLYYVNVNDNDNVNVNVIDNDTI